MANAKPIVLCGKSTQIGLGVIAGLKPEYEVIHFISTSEAGAADIPGLLQGKGPGTSEHSDQIGTKNYAQPAVAVVCGGGYEDDDFKKMRDACGGISGVPWLRPDLTKPTPPLGPEYGKHMVGRVKACLAELERDEKLASDIVVLF